MPRPKRCRRVCCIPDSCHFGPIGINESSAPVVTMSIDEYEAIRIIDLAGLTQEECAARMDVSRTTAQAIYNSARKKLAECLIYGKRLTVSGGNYIVCDGGPGGCGCDCCHKRKAQNLNNKSEETL